MTIDAPALKRLQADDLPIAWLTGLRAGTIVRGRWRGFRVVHLIDPPPAELRAFQHEARRALLRIVRKQDLLPVIKKINRGGPYRYELRPASATGVSAGPVVPGAQIAWQLRPKLRPRALFMRALGDTLIVSDRVSRCEGCRNFFLRRKRHYQRFCNTDCSTAYHNKRRAAEGYFKEHRRRLHGDRSKSPAS